MNKLTLKVSEIKNNSLCLTCGVDFYSRKKCATRTPKYCSKECYAESLKKYKVCGQCNKSFAKCSNKTYCSVECRNNSRRGTKLNSKWRAALSEGRKNSEKCKGPNLYNWKGGKDTLAERMRLHANNRRSSQKIKLDAAFMDRLLLAQKGRCFYCEEVNICCAIGDEFVDGKDYGEIIEIAREYIKSLGGFEKLAEWGLL